MSATPHKRQWMSSGANSDACYITDRIRVVRSSGVLRSKYKRFSYEVQISKPDGWVTTSNHQNSDAAFRTATNIAARRRHEARLHAKARARRQKQQERMERKQAESRLYQEILRKAEGTR